MPTDNFDTRDARDARNGNDANDANDANDTHDTQDSSTLDDDAETRVWLVERTYGDDELNLIILVYATPDGRYYHRRERALTSFTGPARETKASLTVSRDDLGTVDDHETQDRYATEATRVASSHDPDDAI
ncbi:hypothetical protein C483_02805 [Natrialba hulunbeirensis JCM 10989]|uniref:DUF7967 domain-containing protein n=1 Tax=Natrialba hulunbeirensis JCM 10989 TaxID=1227493 RepID=M0A8D4_9EURY|nr:hypothetical protein [Natrialba hulunbeirensis]ELY94626.1 hypothetical protein C483_02805 [Natrialba hulunbeirensis JCM 10989]